MAINDPRDIPGLLAWYSAEAETGYASGAEMSTWTDLSGNGNHATGINGVHPTFGDPTPKPRWSATAGPGGGPTVRFAREGHFALPNIWSGASAGEALIYVKSGDTGNNGHPLYAGTYGSQSHYGNGGTVYETFGITNFRASFSPGTDNIETWRRYNLWHAPNDWAARIDTVTKLSYGAAGLGVGFVTTPRVGSNGTNPFLGDITLVLLWNRKLTVTERADVDAWAQANPSGGLPYDDPYKAEVLADSPWGFWKGAPSGGVLTDSSGNARSMTVTGSPTATIGPDGSTDAIDWPASTSAEHHAMTTAQFNSAAYTIEAWVYLDAIPTAATPLLAQTNGTYGSGSGYDKNLYIATDGSVRLNHYNGGSFVNLIGPVLSTGEWHHVVASAGAAGTKIRVDKTAGASSASTYVYQNAFIWHLHGGGVGYTDGSAVRTWAPAVYPTQLSDARADAHFDAVAAPATPITIAGESFAGSATALDGALRLGVRVAGDPFTFAAAILDGTIAVTTPIIVSGEPFASAAAMLDGTPALGPLIVSGEPFAASTSMLDGSILGAPVRVLGEPFTSAAAMLDGSIRIRIEAATDRVNRANGRTRMCAWGVEIDVPVTTPPRDRGHDYATATSIFGDTLDDGRPT